MLIKHIHFQRPSLIKQVKRAVPNSGAKIISCQILSELHGACVLPFNYHTSISSLFGFSLPLNLNNIQVHKYSISKIP